MKRSNEVTNPQDNLHKKPKYYPQQDASSAYANPMYGYNPAQMAQMNPMSPMNPMAQMCAGYPPQQQMAQQQIYYQQYMAQQYGMMMGPDPTMRTAYVGNLPPNCSMEDLLSHVKGGMIDHVRLVDSKRCAFVTFVDAVSATNFHNDAQARRIVINGHEIKVGWGKQSAINASLMAAIQNGASRCVFIGDVAAHMDETFLRNEFIKYGYVDQVKILVEKRLAFVHMASISNAMKAVAALQAVPEWSGQRINYGKDRCANQNAKTASSSTPFVPAENSNGIRTIFLGGVPSETTPREILDVIRGGMVQSVKVKPEKSIAFVTFIDPMIASSFYSKGMSEGIFLLNGKRLKVGWGNHYPLSSAIMAAVQSGASRCVYLGNIDDSVTDESLNTDFSEYGEIDMISIVRGEKNIAFIHFCDIQSAIKAVEGIKGKEAYRSFKVNYGKDRCVTGNIRSKPLASKKNTEEVSSAPVEAEEGEEEEEKVVQENVAEQEEEKEELAHFEVNKMPTVYENEPVIYGEEEELSGSE